LPHHMQNLVLWNYNRTNTGGTAGTTVNFPFWSPDASNATKMAPPTIVGFHGVGTTFIPADVKRVESNGTKVFPESLFEGQLKLRLGYQSGWLDELNDAAALSGVIIYDATKYNGRAASLQVGLYNKTQLQSLGILDNTTASIKVPLGFYAELYTDDNFTSTPVVFGSRSNWTQFSANLAGQISSIKIFPGATGFDNTNASGTEKMHFKPGTYLASALATFDNKFSSFTVPAGYKVTIYSNGNLTGNSQIVTGGSSYTNLNTQLNNFGSSLVFEPLQQITSFNTNADKNTNTTLSVFANPNNIQLTINSLNTGSALVYIIDINGRLLFEKEIIITNEITMLTFPSVRTGVYVAVLKSKQSNLREKFISR
jgi:hypothetical protein